MKFLPLSFALLVLFTGDALSVSQNVRKFIKLHSEELGDQLEITMGTITTLVAPHFRNAYGAQKLLGIVQAETDEDTKTHKQPNPQLSKYLEEVVKGAVEPLITVITGEHRSVGALFDVSIHLAGEKTYDVQKQATFDQMEGWVAHGMALRKHYLTIIEEGKANQGQQKQPGSIPQNKPQTAGTQPPPQHPQPQNTQPQHTQPKNINIQPPPALPNGWQDIPSPTFSELIQDTNVNTAEMREWYRTHGWKDDDGEDWVPGSPSNFGEKNGNDGNMQTE